MMIAKAPYKAAADLAALVQAGVERYRLRDLPLMVATVSDGKVSVTTRATAAGMFLANDLPGLARDVVSARVPPHAVCTVCITDAGVHVGAIPIYRPKPNVPLGIWAPENITAAALTTASQKGNET